jgi:hypothetical protein
LAQQAFYKVAIGSRVGEKDVFRSGSHIAVAVAVAVTIAVTVEYITARVDARSPNGALPPGPGARPWTPTGVVPRVSDPSLASPSAAYSLRISAEAILARRKRFRTFSSTESVRF